MFSARRIPLASMAWGMEVNMVGHEDRTTADADRRRFLGLAAKLGLAVPPVVTLALTKPSYAAASGFADPPPGGTSGTTGSSSGTTHRGGNSSGNNGQT